MGEEAAAPPTTQISSPRGLTACHVGYLGHLPEDTIHPRLGMVHLMSKGIQHAAKTRMASIPKGSPVHSTSGSQPTPGVPASHALLIQLLPNTARHVFQNPDAPRHHFQLLILLVHDQLQIGGRELLSARNPAVHRLL